MKNWFQGRSKQQIQLIDIQQTEMQKAQSISLQNFLNYLKQLKQSGMSQEKEQEAALQFTRVKIAESDMKDLALADFQELTKLMKKAISHTESKTRTLNQYIEFDLHTAQNYKRENALLAQQIQRQKKNGEELAKKIEGPQSRLGKIH